MAQSIDDMAYSLKMSTEGGRRAEINERTKVQLDFNKKIEAQFQQEYGNKDPRVENMHNMVTLEEQLLKTASGMSEVELKTNQALYDRYLIVAKNAEVAKLARNEADQAYSQMAEHGHAEITAKYVNDFGTEKDLAGDADKLKEYKDREKQQHKSYNNILSNLRKTVEREVEISRGDYANEAARKSANTRNANKRNKLMGEAESLGVTLETSEEYVQRYRQYLSLRERAAKLTEEERKEYQLLYEVTESPETRAIHQQRYNELKAREQELTADERADLERLAPLYEEVAVKKMSFGEAAVKAGQMLSAATAAANALKGIVDTINNEDLTIGEKILSVSSSVGMLIPQIMMLTSSYAALAGGAGKAALTEALFNTSVALGGTVAEGTTAANISLAGSVSLLGRTIMTALPQLALLALGIAAIVSVVYLVVKAFEKWKASTPEGKLDALTKKSEEAADAARNIVGAYEDLNSELDELKNKQDALKGLEKGTTEYRLAVAKLNQQMIDLLDKYDLWSQAEVKMANDGSGLLEVTNFESLMAAELEKRAYATEIANENTIASNLAREKQRTLNES